MRSDSNTIDVRPADLSGADHAVVSRLVAAYLAHTEVDKAGHLGGEGAQHGLPERYRREVEHPADAYESARVHLAEQHGVAVGVIVIQEHATFREVKRVWVDSSARGQRVGSALMDAALAQRDLPIRLTVWEWRGDAIRLYRRRGFVPVASWEDRAALVCMELPPATR
jgi:ribosomal protein S18 acetylase RimI-like enzyme